MCSTGDEFSNPPAFLIVITPAEYETFIKSSATMVGSFHKSGLGLEVPKHIPDNSSSQFGVQEIGDSSRLIASVHFDLERPQKIIDDTEWLGAFLDVCEEP